MSRVPTENQYRRLRLIANGNAIVWSRATDHVTRALIDREWATGEISYYDGRPGWGWVRITPAGLRALADAVERYGLPELMGRGAVERSAAGSPAP